MIGFIIEIALCFLAGYLGSKLMKGRPDGLLRVGGVNVNVPLMTSPQPTPPPL